MGLLCDPRGPCRVVVGVVHKELSCFVTAGPLLSSHPALAPVPETFASGQASITCSHEDMCRRVAPRLWLLIESRNCLPPLSPEPPSCP